MMHPGVHAQAKYGKIKVPKQVQVESPEIQDKIGEMVSRSRTYASPKCDQTTCTMLVSERVSVSCRLATPITKIDSGRASSLTNLFLVQDCFSD